MAKLPKPPLGKRDLDSKWRHELHKESDRGKLLLISAYLESALAEVLSEYFLDDQKLRENLMEHRGPLATFSAKIDLVYALGLVDEAEWRALNAIRSMRNEVAHDIDSELFGPSMREGLGNLNRDLGGRRG